jgi:hypothetical protein
MSYQVRFTDTTKTPLTVDDQTINSEKSLKFVGKNYAGYSQYIAENFLHLLENFAKSTAPGNPITGQLWFNTTTGSENQLKVYNGTNWVAAGNVKKSTTAPSWFMDFPSAKDTYRMVDQSTVFNCVLESSVR